MQAVTKFSAELGRTLHQWRVWKRTSCAQSVKRLKTPPKKDRLHSLKNKMLQIVYMLGHTGPFHNATKGRFTIQQRATQGCFPMQKKVSYPKRW